MEEWKERAEVSNGVKATTVPSRVKEGRLARLPSPRTRGFSSPGQREEPHEEPPLYFHHGLVSVRKSVSVHGDRVTMSSGVSAWASASERGAGPRMTLPVKSY